MAMWLSACCGSGGPGFDEDEFNHEVLQRKPSMVDSYFFSNATQSYFNSTGIESSSQRRNSNSIVDSSPKEFELRSRIQFPTTLPNIADLTCTLIHPQRTLTELLILYRDVYMFMSRGFESHEAQPTMRFPDIFVQLCGSQLVVADRVEFPLIEAINIYPIILKHHPDQPWVLVLKYPSRRLGIVVEDECRAKAMTMCLRFLQQKLWEENGGEGLAGEFNESLFKAKQQGKTQPKLVTTEIKSPNNYSSNNIPKGFNNDIRAANGITPVRILPGDRPKGDKIPGVTTRDPFLSQSFGFNAVKSDDKVSSSRSNSVCSSNNVNNANEKNTVKLKTGTIIINKIELDSKKENSNGILHKKNSIPVTSNKRDIFPVVNSQPSVASTNSISGNSVTQRRIVVQGSTIVYNNNSTSTNISSKNPHVQLPPALPSASKISSSDLSSNQQSLKHTPSHSIQINSHINNNGANDDNATNKSKKLHNHNNSDVSSSHFNLEAGGAVLDLILDDISEDGALLSSSK